MGVMARRVYVLGPLYVAGGPRPIHAGHVDMSHSMIRMQLLHGARLDDFLQFLVLKIKGFGGNGTAPV